MQRIAIYIYNFVQFCSAKYLALGLSNIFPGSPQLSLHGTSNNTVNYTYKLHEQDQCNGIQRGNGANNPTTDGVVHVFYCSWT